MTNPPEARETVAQILRDSPDLITSAVVDGQHILVTLSDGTPVTLLHVTSSRERTLPRGVQIGHGNTHINTF